MSPMVVPLEMTGIPCTAKAKDDIFTDFIVKTKGKACSVGLGANLHPVMFEGEAIAKGLKPDTARIGATAGEIGKAVKEGNELSIDFSLHLSKGAVRGGMHLIEGIVDGVETEAVKGG